MGMEIGELSRRYEVRKLEEVDIDMIYELSAGNPMFYEYCLPYVTKESILDDMKALPHEKSFEDKYYIGFFQEGELIAVMDLILRYPNKETAFIGLFMMRKESQGKGIGSGIIRECLDFLKAQDYRFVQLCFAKGNPQSEAFWKKNGFTGRNMEFATENYISVAMERKL